MAPTDGDMAEGVYRSFDVEGVSDATCPISKVSQPVFWMPSTSAPMSTRSELSHSQSSSTTIVASVP